MILYKAFQLVGCFEAH